MRGDVDGYVAEFNPIRAPIGTEVVHGLVQRATAATRSRSGASSATAASRSTPQKRLPMYQKLNKVLMDELLEVPLVSVSKFLVVNKRLKNMYVAFTDFNPGLRTAYIVS